MALGGVVAALAGTFSPPVAVEPAPLAALAVPAPLEPLRLPTITHQRTSIAAVRTAAAVVRVTPPTPHPIDGAESNDA